MRRFICFCMGILLAGIMGPGLAEADTVSAKAYLVMESSLGQIVSEKCGNDRLPMASTTKIMTAYLTLEQEKLQESFAVDAAAVSVEGSSMGLTAGDTVTLYDLACGMLLASGNDAANAAAVKIAGSLSGFADMMNQKAEELGLDDTHFANPSGLPDDAHYSSARDLAVLTAAALENADFAEICASRQHSVQISGQRRILSNHNRLLKMYDGCVGVKTGFTKKAGRCLVSAAKRKDVTLICVTLAAPDDWNDHRKLLDHGFEHVKQTELKPQQKECYPVVVGGIKKNVKAFVFGQPSVCLSEEESHSITQKWQMQAFYYAPVSAGEVLGQVRYLYQGKEIAVSPVLAAESCGYRSVVPQKKQ